MIAATLVDEIKRLLREGGLSQRKIARRLAVSRGTVNAIALGKRPECKSRRTEAGEDFFPPTGPVARCRGCGAMVRMPCLACQIRTRSNRRPALGITARSAISPCTTRAYRKLGNRDLNPN